MYCRIEHRNHLDVRVKSSSRASFAWRSAFFDIENVYFQDYVKGQEYAGLTSSLLTTGIAGPACGLWIGNRDLNPTIIDRMHSMTPFVPKNILLLPNAAVPKASLLADRISACLKTQAVDHNIFCYDYEHPTQVPHIDGHDLVIVIGGDGTLLRAGHLCAPLDIPLLGVQAGRLGFLVELNENDIEKNLQRLLNADYHLERRMMLQAEFLENGDVKQRWDVINEALISRGRDARPIEVRVDLNEGYMMSYIADGLIVATATGSTAYALAAGGPILPPELRNMLVLPIAPHLSLDRAVVLAEGAVVNLRAISDFEVVLSVDGTTPISIGPENSIRVTANKKSLLMARFGEPNYFYRDLAAILQRNPILEMESHD